MAQILNNEAIQEKYNQNRKYDTLGNFIGQPTTVNDTTNSTIPMEQSIPKPTVATSTNPVVSKTYPTVNTYKPTDYSSIDTLDNKGLDDYLDQLNYKVQYDKKPLTQEEYLNAQRASRRKQELAKEQINVDPYKDIISKAQSDYDTKRTSLAADDETKLAPQFEQIDDEYNRQVSEAERLGGSREKALQGGLSFSGFGRSTYAQEGIQKIQDATASNVRTINLAREAQKQAARLAEQGADARVLDGLNNYINSLMSDSAKTQASIIQETNKLNKEAGLQYTDRINNILELANKNVAGITYDKATPEERAQIDAYATLAIDDEGNINEALLKTVPANISMAVLQRGALLKSQIPNGDYQYVGADKYNNPIVFDKKTGKVISAPGYTAKGSGGGVGGSSNPLTSTGEINYDALSFKNQEQANAFGYVTRMIDAEKVFNTTEDAVAGTNAVKGAIQRNLPSAVQSDLFRQQEQAERNFINSVLRRESGAAISAGEFANAKKQYFPQPGDDATTLEQKRQNRATVMKSTAAQSGKNNASQVLPIVQTVTSKKVVSPEVKAASSKSGAGTTSSTPKNLDELRDSL